LQILFTAASIMRLIKDWLNNEHVIVADDVLIEMRKFVLDVNGLLETLDINDLYLLERLVLEVVQGIREKVCMRAFL
jgi:hypothetical protein